jgi:hypothetical protein
MLGGVAAPGEMRVLPGVTLIRLYPMPNMRAPKYLLADHRSMHTAGVKHQQRMPRMLSELGRYARAIVFHEHCSLGFVKGRILLFERM